MPAASLMDAVDLLMDVDDIFGKDAACPASIDKKHERFILITGDNASGKSFMAKHLKVGFDESGEKVEFIPVTMEMRTAPGMQRAFMFGMEDHSTGNVSVRSVLTALRTCRERTQRHFLLLDEPDIGVSESYARAMGETIARFVNEMPELTVGLAVVTHSRAMVRELMAVNPTSIRVGADQRPLAQWLEEGPEFRSVADLEALAGETHTRMRTIKSVLDSRDDPPAPRR